MLNEQMKRFAIYLAPEDVDAIDKEQDRLRREQGLRASKSQAALALIRRAAPPEQVA